MVIAATLNTWTIGIFGPLLIVVGIAGFLIPADRALTSGAPAYNVFHIAFGVLAVIVWLSGNQPAMRTFTIGFGAIDLYQAVASSHRLFPYRHFRWTRVDDFAHVVIGALLIVAGLVG